MTNIWNTAHKLSVFPGKSGLEKKFLYSLISHISKAKSLQTLERDFCVTMQACDESKMQCSSSIGLI